MARPLSHESGRAQAIAATVALLGAGLAALAPTVPAHALSGTTFDAGDGNLVVEGAETDWASFAAAIRCTPPRAGCAVDRPTGATDDALGQGAKDDDTTVQVVTGGVPNNKSDLARAYVAGETVGEDTFLYLGWVRNNTLGTANFSIELNQVAQTETPEPGPPYTINRTAGDLLVLYDFASGGKAEKVELGLSEWVTTGDPRQVCQANNTVPCWGQVRDLDAAGVAAGSINTSPVTDSLFPEPGGGAVLTELTFGEAAVNLTKAGVLGACKGFASAMIRSRSSDAFNAELKDFIIPARIDLHAPVEVTNWGSNGAAMTARVFDSQLMNPARDLGPEAASSQTGAGSNESSDSLGSIDVPAQDLADDGNPVTPAPPKKGGIVHTDLLAASAKSVVDRPGAITTQTSAATAAGVNILAGTVTADVVMSVAMTDATVNHATPDTDFSGLKNVRIDVDGNPDTPPLAMNNVAPNTRIDLSPAAFGPGSYVELRREHLATHFPAPGTPIGEQVRFAADVVEITGLHLHVTDRTTDTLLSDDGDVTTDVLISSATAHSESQGILCKAVQAVEGNATVLRGNVGDLAGATVGHVAIAEGGGASHQELEGFTLGDPPLARLGVSTSHSEGSWSESASTANSLAQVANLCVDLDGSAGCEISAEAVTSQVNSTATAADRTSTGFASFLGLSILGHMVNPQPGLIQQIPGLGVVAVDERACDAGNLTGDTCTTADGTRTAMTVRALHIVVNEPLPQPNPLGLRLGSELVIADAHSGATFVAPN
jgi:hypothetical protein